MTIMDFEINFGARVDPGLEVNIAKLNHVNLNHFEV